MLDAITAGEEFRLALRTCTAKLARGRFAATEIYHIAGDAAGRTRPAVAVIQESNSCA